MNNTKKTFILEWEEKGLKDEGSWVLDDETLNNEVICYEKFRVIAGSDKENLLFYSTFFNKENLNKIKLGLVFKLSVPGNLVEDASGIVNGIDNDGSYEFEKIEPLLLIKELWEKDKSNQKELELLRGEVEGKKGLAEKVNRDLLNKLGELSNLEEKFKNLQFEKTAIESSWLSPQRLKSLNQDVEDLKKKLESERRGKQELSEQLKVISSQEWEISIEKKLKEKKNEQEKLKIAASNKLSEENHFLPILLDYMKQIDSLVFRGVDEAMCHLMKKGLQGIKDKIAKKLSKDEILELCKSQSEITKLEMQLEQWKKLNSFQTYIEFPAHN